MLHHSDVNSIDKVKIRSTLKFNSPPNGDIPLGRQREGCSDMGMLVRGRSLRKCPEKSIDNKQMK